MGRQPVPLMPLAYPYEWLLDIFAPGTKFTPIAKYEFKLDRGAYRLIGYCNVGIVVCVIGLIIYFLRRL